MENKTWSVQQTINDFLQKETEERKNKKAEYFYASSLGSCKRKQIWKRMNEPETNPADNRTLRIFSVGNIFHEWIQDLLEKAGVLINKEQTIINEEYNYKGRYDALCEKDGKKLLYDIKSQSSRSFHYLKEKGGGIDEAKKMQVVSYAVMGNLPVEECRILFVSKDDLCVMEFSVAVKDFKQKVIDELVELNKFFKNKEIPAELPLENGKASWQCGYCNYRDKCKNKGRQNNKIT